MDTSPIDPIDPSLELSHIEQSFEMLGGWLNETIIELAEGDDTPEKLQKDAELLLPKLDQYERSIDTLCYQAYQLAWDFLPPQDLYFNYPVIHRLKRHKNRLLLNGIRPLRQFFTTH